MSDIRFNRWLHNSGTGGVYQDSSGRVGIGSSVPTSSLDIAGAIKATDFYFSNSSVFNYVTNSGPNLIINGDDNIIFRTDNDIEKVRILPSGYVGIGTTIPDNKLVVFDPSNTCRIRVKSGTASTGFDFQQAVNGVAYLWNRDNTSLIFGTNNNEVARFDNIGNIHSGYTSNFGLDKLNLLASDGGGISIARDNNGLLGAGSTMGSISFQSYLNSQTHLSAEAKISAIAAETQSGSTAATDLAFYTKPTGTGPGSPATERMRLDNVGRILVGTTGAFDTDAVSQNYRLGIERLGGYSALSIKTNTADANGAYVSLGKSRGTSANSKTSVNSGDDIGAIYWDAADGTNMKYVGQILMAVDGSPSTGIVPSRLVFSTMNSSGTVGERVRITSAGNVGIGTDNPSTILHTYSTSQASNRFQYHTPTTLSSSTISAEFKTSSNSLSVGARTGFQFVLQEASNPYIGAYIQSVRENASHHQGLSFSTWNGDAATPSERVRISKDGYLGIGTDNPQATLHVQGNTLASYSILNSTLQVNSATDALSYFTVDGDSSYFSYAGTYIGLASRPGYSIAANLYVGGGYPIIPSGWTGTISALAVANATSLATTVYLQTSTDGTTWTTRDNTSGSSGKTLSYSVSSSATPLYVRFNFAQSSGGSVGANNCAIYNLTITNLPVLPKAPSISSRLTVDNAGRITTANQPAFHATKITGDTLTTTAAKLTFGTATYDVASNYSDANDRFTAPVAGKYFFYCSINVLNSANVAYIQIRKNGSVYGQVQYAATNFPRMDFNPSAVFDMASGDYVEVYGLMNTGTTTVDNAGFFGGYLLG